MHNAALVQPLEPLAECCLEARDKVAVRRAAVEEERQLRAQRGGERELGPERVQLQQLATVVQPVVVQAELAKGDELLLLRPRGPGVLDQASEV